MPIERAKQPQPSSSGRRTPILSTQRPALIARIAGRMENIAKVMPTCSGEAPRSMANKASRSFAPIVPMCARITTIITWVKVATVASE